MWKKSLALASLLTACGAQNTSVLQNETVVEKAVSCSTPVMKPIPGTADMMYLDAAIDIRFDAKACEGQGGYTLLGSASRTGGFAGFSDFEMIHTDVCVPAGQLQSARIKTAESEAQFQVTKVGANGIEKATLTMDSGRLNGSNYRLSCQVVD